MQIVLFLDLLLKLSLHVQAHDERIALTRCRGGVGVNQAKSLVQVPHGFARAIDFLLDGILEIARQALDLLGLLLQVTSETSQLTDHLHLHLYRLVCLGITLSMEISEDLCRIGETSRLKEGGWKSLVVDHVGGR